MAMVVLVAVVVMLVVFLVLVVVLVVVVYLTRAAFPRYSSSILPATQERLEGERKVKLL